MLDQMLDILKSYNCNTELVDLESITIQTLSSISDNIKQKYMTFWKHKIENTSKTKLLQYVQNRIPLRRISPNNKKKQLKERHSQGFD